MFQLHGVGAEDLLRTDEETEFVSIVSSVWAEAKLESRIDAHPKSSLIVAQLNVQI